VSAVFLVDDHTLVRDGLRAVLGQAGHQVVGEAGDIVSALEDILAPKPDILLLALQIESRSGLELLVQLQRRQVPIKTVVLAAPNQPGLIAEAERLGAEGCVLKDAPASEVVIAIERVSRGDRHWGPEVKRLLAAHKATGNAALEKLSLRERQVLLLLVRGHTSSAMGQKLLLSPKTVDTYRSRLMAKLGVADVPALVRLAIREGLIGVDEI
jgi:two-component system invasion response regulator UvrY